MRTSSELQLGLKITPQLILTREILTLSTEALALRIDAEVANNPALDWDGPAPRWTADGAPSSPTANRDDNEFAEGLSAPYSLADYLLDQLRLHLSAADMPIGFELVGSLDSHGWLAEDTGAIADRLNVPVTTVDRVLRILQSLDPPGIGARSLQEALLIQLDQVEQAHEARVQLARRLIADHLDDVGRQAWTRLARLLKVSSADIEAALDFIRDNLVPYPAHTYWGDDSSVSAPDPDVIIQPASAMSDRAWHILVTEESRYAVRLVPEVAQATSALPAIGEYVERARLFIASLRQRWRTLKRVVGVLVEAQTDFVRCGPAHLRPLTQIDVARTLNLHESTISRTIRHKYAQLPNGRIVPLTAFFTTDAPAKTALQAMIAAENAPLTDQELCEALARQGLTLSRRTIAKYRAELGIPSTHRRVARSR